MKKRNFIATSLLSALMAAGFCSAALAANPVLKIGFVGVTSGPAASWASLTNGPWRPVLI